MKKHIVMISLTLFAGLTLGVIHSEILFGDSSLPKGQNNVRNAYASLSSGHRSLVSQINRCARIAIRGTAPGARPVTVKKIRQKADVTEQLPQADGPARIYCAPGQEEAALLARSLAEALRRERPGEKNLPLLAELKGLSGIAAGTGKNSPVLASSSDNLPEPTVEEIEPNDSRQEAQKIAYSDVVAAGSVPQKDLDVFSFEAADGDYVRIEVQPVGEGWVTALLFDSDSNLVHSGHYGIIEPLDAKPYDSRQGISSMLPIWAGGNVIGRSLEAGGTYFIVVWSFPGQIRWLDTNAAKAVDETEIEQAEISYRLMLTNPPTYQVAGSVIDDTGAPVAGAEIMVWPHDGTGAAGAVTEDDGSFTLSLPQGAYSASVEGPAGSRYPTGQVGEQFKVSEGGARLKFTLKSGVVFSGRAVDDRGEVVQNLHFSLIDRKARQYRWGNSDDNGYFSVAIFPGTYDLYLHASWEYPPQPVTRGIEILEDIEYIILVDTGNRIAGLVLSPEGEPLAGVSLNFYGERDNRFARSATDGSYQVNLSAGLYRIEAQPPGGVLLPRQEAGTLTVEGDMKYDIHLAGGGIIAGSVIDSRGNAVQGAGINLWKEWTAAGESSPDSVREGENITVVKTVSADPDDGDEDYNVRAYPGRTERLYLRTDTLGAWQAAVMPGTWYVEVTAPRTYPDQWLKGGAYTVAAGEKVKAETVTIEHGVFFKGHVFLPDGSPLEYGCFQLSTHSADNEQAVAGMDDEVVLLPEKPMPYYPWRSYWVQTGEGGQFVVRVLAGTYDLYFEGRQ
ncbi:MAG: carboxypeptidase-like regulatory domain-containing protein, partial [Gemmatimonadota bacterium]|nr:carboxypeptidase-like regulatory domain-containing protein [Gemmatimonadota bacterium]